MILLTKLLCILISLLLLALVLHLRRYSGSWLTPGGIWGVIWFLLVIIPLVAAPEAPANPLAILYILVATAVFALPVLQTRWRSVWSAAHFDNPDLYRSAFLRAAYLIVSVTALASVAMNLTIQGVTLDRLSGDFLSVTNELIVDRYTGSTIDNIFTQLSNVLTYSSAGLGGVVFFGLQRARARAFVIALTMAPPLALMTIAGAKGAIFLCIAIFYGAFLAAKVRTGGTDILNRKNIIGVLLSVLILVPFIIVSFLGRGLYGQITESELADALYRNFISYSSAHIYAFSDWFSWYTEGRSTLVFVRDDPAWGFNTFYSIFKALGSTRTVPPGFYDEYFQYDWYLQTNIYTVFRGLITDFTLVGSLVFMYAAGFAANIAFLAMVRSKEPSWSISFYALFCGLAYTSFIISLFVWNSAYLVFVILALVLRLNHWWASRLRLAQVCA